MKKLIILTTDVLVRFSFTGNINEVNHELNSLGYKQLPVDSPAKSVGKELDKLFALFCKQIGANTDKKRTVVKNLFYDSVNAECPPKLKTVLKNFKKEEVKIALINHSYRLEKKLDQVGVKKNLFNFVDQSDSKKGTAEVLKKSLSWADQQLIERDQILFVGTKAHDYISALNSKPEIDFLGISCSYKNDHFTDMGLTKKRTSTFDKTAKKIKKVVNE
jgi:hypothetical protein